MKTLLYSLMVIWMTVNLNAQSSDLGKAANIAYLAGNYREAISLYDSLINDGYQNADLYYNLGNAYWKVNDLPQAILNYERALKRKPYHQDVRHNLKILFQQQEDDFAVIKDFFLLRWRNSLANYLSSITWAWISLIWLWIALFGWVGFLFFRSRWNPKTLIVIAVIGLILSGSGYYFGLVRHHLEEAVDQAIFMSDQAPLYSAPDVASPNIYSIHAGLKVRILDQIDDWMKVQLSNKDEGWIQADKLSRI